MTEEFTEKELEEETEINVLEFSLGSNEIDEIIEDLKELKQSKESFVFPVDDENELLIHYEVDEE